MVVSKITKSHTSRSYECCRDCQQGDNIITAWIYSLDDNTWTPILEPRRSLVGASAGGSVSSAQPQTPVMAQPVPRLGHTVTYGVVGRSFWVFGGNSGNEQRWNDLWMLKVKK